MSKVKIEYEYQDVKIQPYRVDGILRYKHILQWFVGSELVDEDKVEERNKALSKVIAYNGGKKFRNVTIIN